MAGTIPLILSLADELNDHLYYRNYPQRPYHHHHPSLSLVGPAFNLIHKANCNKNDAPSPTPVVGKNGFQASIDVQQYKPNELTVKTVDNCIVVEGKHEEREDEHGDIFRHFIRRYVLPEGYDPKDVISTLSSDGILTVKVAPPQPAESNERIINIQHTGPAHLSVKDNSSEEKEKKPEEEKKKPAEEKKQKK